MNAPSPKVQTILASAPAERARQLRPLIEAASPAIERERVLTREVLEALYDARLFKMLLPKSCGGDETDPLSFIAAIEELAKADGSTAWCVAQASGCTLAAAYLEPAVAQEVFGARDAVLAWGPVGPTVRTTAVEGGFRVNGTWSYASGSRHAQWLGGHSPLVDADGKPCIGADGRPAERTTLFPKDKATIRDVWQVMGLKGTGSDSYTVTNLFVPARYSFTREFPSERRESGSLYRFTTYQIYGSAFAAVALGLARATLDALMQMASTKVPMLGSKPLRDNPGRARLDATAGAASARRRARQPSKQRGGRNRLPLRRRHRDLREPGFRASAARHPRSHAAGAVAIRQLRGRRPGAARIAGHV
jgi:alkylation response protein AidB-like acyl-CoA dehydrogenase